jgi:predicted GIY-YIG superfamily endonuclease
MVPTNDKMEKLKNRGFTPYRLSDVKELFKGGGVNAPEDTIRYVYLIYNQDECLYINSTDPSHMKSVLKTLRAQGSLLAQEINPDTLIYVKGFTESETAITEENEIREVIKPKYNLLAVFHGIFESLKRPESVEDNDVDTNTENV